MAATPGRAASAAAEAADLRKLRRVTSSLTLSFISIRSSARVHSRRQTPTPTPPHPPTPHPHLPPPPHPPPPPPFDFGFSSCRRGTCFRNSSRSGARWHIYDL